MGRMMTDIKEDEGFEINCQVGQHKAVDISAPCNSRGTSYTEQARCNNDWHHNDTLKIKTSIKL